MVHQDGDSQAQVLGSIASLTSQPDWSDVDFPDYLQTNENHTSFDPKKIQFLM